MSKLLLAGQPNDVCVSLPVRSVSVAGPRNSDSASDRREGEQSAFPAEGNSRMKAWALMLVAIASAAKANESRCALGAAGRELTALSDAAPYWPLPSYSMCCQLLLAEIGPVARELT
jgi:hypothetical protein